MDFYEITKKRYATKKFDGKIVDEKTMDKLYEMIRMSASSFGLQPYQIKVISDKKTKEDLLVASNNQVQITTCSHLLVFCAYTDIDKRIEEYKKMMLELGTPKEKAEGYANWMIGFKNNLTKEQQIIWTQKQCYLALANALNGAKSLELDSCPMEGFNSAEYAKILNLPENLIPTLVCPIGYGADKQKPKIRFSKEDLFF